MLVTVVRQTEPQGLELGHPILPLARAAPQRVPGAPPRSEDQRARLDPQLTAALEAQQRIAHQSRRLPPGNAVAHGTIVHADDPTSAPIGQGPRHGPAPCGRQPGMMAEPAAGGLLGRYRPRGHPREGSEVPPVVDHAPQAMARVAPAPRPTIHALAGDLACHEAALREGLPPQGMLTVGIPQTVAPLPPSPTPEAVLRLVPAGAAPRARTPCQVALAYACGSSRPVVERRMASWRCRGAARVTDQGQRGAIVHIARATMAHHAATVARIQEYRLSNRARTFRRRLRLRCRQVNQRHASIHEWSLRS